MLLETLSVPITSLEENKGQIEGLPKNPRIIKDGKFRKLMQSIKDDPEMMNLRELIVFPLKKKFVVIGGNMRLKACLELGYKELPCKILNPKVSPAQLRALVQKDNVSFGENDWDLLANEWDSMELEYWGVDLPKDWNEPEKEIDTSPKLPLMTLKIEFPDFDQYQEAKDRIEKILSDYPGTTLK